MTSFENQQLPPRADGKEEERELNVSKEIQQRKKWLSSMNDLWKKEYLHQVLGSQGEVWTTRPNPLKEREIVLVADDREKRLNWRLGVVQKLHIGRDGRCRAAVVRVKSGLLRRPIYKLEICAETDNLPPITSCPESFDVDDDDEMQNSTVELIDEEEDAVEWQVSPPRRTRSGREVVRPHRFRDN